MPKITKDDDDDDTAKADASSSVDDDEATVADDDEPAAKAAPVKKTTHKAAPKTTPVVVRTGPPAWVAPAALLVAVIAVGVAVFALVKSPTQTDVAVTGSDGDSKTRVCQKFNTVRNAVSLQTHADIGQEPAAIQAVAANARLAMSAGGSALLEQVDSSTPKDLADAVSNFANGLQDISINALAGITNNDPAQTALLQNTEAASKTVTDLCK